MKNAFFLLLAACLVTGCQTPYEFQKPTSRWQNETGQLQYSNPKRSIIGEVEISSLGTSEFQFDFSAGPGYSIMKLRQSGNIARAEIAFAHISWQGQPSREPGQLRPWFALKDVLSRATSQPAGATRVALQSDSPGFWKADGTLSGGRPKDLTVNFPRSKERFVFHFNR